MKKITTSGFQFTNPRAKKILFQLNSDFDKSKYKGLDISYNIGVFEKKESSATVELELVIGHDGDESPFYLELNISSNFRWTDNINGSEDKYLKLNAASLLMSYARPIIAHITTDAGLPPFNLPFVDLRSDMKEPE